ncbi:hypothetical protein, partial [Selenomonas bovis]|uniref:hypothetical protein n=1 Tax=Selenomonas bovis TaxID=416586 RepID=UPI001B7FCC00
YACCQGFLSPWQHFLQTKRGCYTLLIRATAPRRSLGAASKNEMNPLMIAKSSGIGSATSCWEGAAMMS